MLYQGVFTGDTRAHRATPPGGPGTQAPHRGNTPPTPPTRQHSPHRESSYEGRGAKTGGSDHDEMVGGSRGTETEGPKGPFARSSLRPLVES